MPSEEHTAGEPLTIDAIERTVLQRYRGVMPGRNWGERAIFYNPDALLPKGVYFMTFKERDGPNDSASRIPPDGFRWNIGLTRDSFLALFDRVPARPPAGGIVATGHDFTRQDRVMPHPVYGWMCWIAVVNPSRSTFDALLDDVDRAYEHAVKKFRARVR